MYEVRGDAPRRSGWRRPVGSGGAPRVSLPAKTVIFARLDIFVGSLNLDLRSIRLNNAIRLVINGPVFAQALAQGWQQQLPESS